MPCSKYLEIVLLVFMTAGPSASRAEEDFGSRLKGLVYEVEHWTEPQSAWNENRSSHDRWNLWSREEDIRQKRSGGASLQSPVIREDRKTPQDGAPPLHTRITGIPAAIYGVHINNPGRCMAYSLDGQNWQRSRPGAEIDLGVFSIRDGLFEVWVDDRYATPNAIGPCYYDYIRFEEFTPPAFSHFETYPAGDGRVQVSWITSIPIDTGRLVALEEPTVKPLADSDVTDQRNHRVWIKPGEFTPGMKVRVEIAMGPRYVLESATVCLKAIAAADDSRTTPREIPLTLAAKSIQERPVCAGIPLSPGQVAGRHTAWIENSGTPVPSQTSVTACWPDGSVKWLLTRFIPQEQQHAYTFHVTPVGEQTNNPIIIRRSGNHLSIDNARLKLSFSLERFALFDQVTASSGSAYTGHPMLGNIRIMDARHETWGLGNPDIIHIEEEGPIRAILKVEGPFIDATETERFRYRIRYFITAGSPLIRVQLTLINDIVENEFQRLSSFAFRVPLPAEGPLYAQLPEITNAEIADTQIVAIQQVSEKSMRITQAGQTRTADARCPGWVVAERGTSRIAIALRDFWQTWPKAIAVKSDGIHVRLLPELTESEYKPKDLHDWTRHTWWFDKGHYLFKRAMAYRAEFWVRFDSPEDPVPQGSWDDWAQALHHQPYASPGPEYACATSVFGPVSPASPGPLEQYEHMVDRNHSQILKLREIKAEYGWMSFGDWHGERTFNWGNSEYDLAWAMAIQFARTGRWEYFRTGEEITRHYTSIDAIHIPCPPYNRRYIYAHTIGHVGAGTTPADARIADKHWDTWYEGNKYFYTGTIEPTGHIFLEGTLMYYLLTGDRDYLDVAEYAVVEQSDHLTPRFRFHIERSAGWPITNAVAAWRTTGNPFYLNAARLYVEKVLQTQEPEGNWLLPQDASECDHPQPHYGSKSFATGVLLYSLMQYDLVEPRDDVKNSIVHACNWLVEKAWNTQKKGFRYKTGCDRYIDNADDNATSQAICSAGLAYGYQLSADPRFLDILRICLNNLRGKTGDNGKHATMLMRHSAYALPVLQGSPSIATDKNPRIQHAATPMDR